MAKLIEKKSAVTISDVQEGGTKEDKWYQRYIYAECSYCEMFNHLMRISLYYERGKNGELFSSVDLQMPSEWYLAQPWFNVPKGWVNRLLWGVGRFFRVLKLSLAVLFGRPVHLSASTDFTLATAKDLGQKLVKAVEEAEKVLKRDWSEDKKIC